MPLGVALLELGLHRSLALLVQLDQQRIPILLRSRQQVIEQAVTHRLREMRVAQVGLRSGAW